MTRSGFGHGPDTEGRWTLTKKLLLGLTGVGALMVLWQFVQIGPVIESGFRERAAALIELGHRDLKDLASEDVEASRELLVTVIEHATDARRRALLDLPLSIYAADVEQLRTALIDDDAQRGERLRANAQVIAREMAIRSDRRIERWLAELESEQRVTSAAFASDFRRAYLLVSAGLFLALLGLLGFGLYRSVVRPVRNLRAATRDVASGNLEVHIETPTGGDEVTALARDFSSMVAQLRESQEALAELNQNLEREVKRKTERLERTQRQLVQAEKMSSIGTLAGGIAHEFNNLIGGIRGCTAELLADAKTASDAEPLEVILRASDRASAITDQLLRFSRQRVGAMERIDLAAVVAEALLLVAPRARQLGVTLKEHLVQPLPVTADASALHQVLLNLFTNALQAMAEVDSRTLTTTTFRDGECAGVRVEDTGCGIAEDRLEQVFLPFFTSKGDHVDPDRRGAGLGLSVSYGIAEAHGGALAVHSVEGRGATFTLTLPTTGPDEARGGNLQ